MTNAKRSVIDTRMITWVCGTGVALTLSLATLSYARFIQQVRREVATLLAQSDCGQDGVITDQMLEGLPEPARRYLAYSGVVGRPRVRTVYLTQKGRMRAGEQLPWLPLDARQWYSVSPPGFVWDGRLHLGPLPIARARDLYLHGRGSLAVRAAQAIPVADSAGAEMDQGAMLRYLAEMIWFPAALLEANVSFAPIDGRSIRVTLTDNGRSVSGTLHIDEAGRLLRFDAERYRMVDGGFQLCHWSAVVTEYGEFEGLKLPTRAQALWHLEKGDLPYFDVGIEELRYR